MAGVTAGAASRQPSPVTGVLLLVPNA